MRTAVPHVYAAGDVAGRWQLAHTAFREGEIAAENAMGHEARLGEPAVPRPIYTDPEIAGVGLTESRRASSTATPSRSACSRGSRTRAPSCRARPTGWVKSIHETTYGELLGLVIVGPHATDLIEAGVVALDAESTVETVADGIAPHPTLSEAIKEAGLVALGRAIHLPPKRRVVGAGSALAPRAEVRLDGCRSVRRALITSVGLMLVRRKLQRQSGPGAAIALVGLELFGPRILQRAPPARLGAGADDRRRHRGRRVLVVATARSSGYRRRRRRRRGPGQSPCRRRRTTCQPPPDWAPEAA